MLPGIAAYCDPSFCEDLGLRSVSHHHRRCTCQTEPRNSYPLYSRVLLRVPLSPSYLTARPRPPTTALPGRRTTRRRAVTGTTASNTLPTVIAGISRTST